MIPEGTIINPGDEFVKHAPDMRGTKRIVKVSRVTPSGRIVLPNGEQYRPDGKSVKVYDRWGTRAELSLPTPELRSEISRASNMSIIKEFNLNDLDDDQLAQIVAILNKKVSK